MYNAKGVKGVGILIIVLLAGVIFGGFLGELLTRLIGSNPVLDVLNYSRIFGLTDPFSLDFGVLAFSFGLTIRFSVWSLIGMATSYLIYKKM